MESPRCQILPLPNHEVAFRIDGIERTRWHCGAQYPRPFFYPMRGPSGVSLTRMGHPGAPNHDHHRSVWFAHDKVLGIDFWADRTDARIRQREWLCYEDGDGEARMAVLLDWFDGHDPKPLLEQELIAAVRPGDGKEFFLELRSTFRPTAESLEFGQTNFGFLAVRLAKHISAHFGDGRIVNSAGDTDEPAVFGKRAKWVEYSADEGITFFDHPSNPGYPNRWHVREDGWMGASICFGGPVETAKAEPLLLGHLLHVHAGGADAERADRIAAGFAGRPAYAVERSDAKHQQWRIRTR